MMKKYNLNGLFMKNIFVKIVFKVDAQAVEDQKGLTFDNYEEKVRADIRKGNNVSCTVYLKNLMPQSEMDRIILELCTRITWDGHKPITYGSIGREYTFWGGIDADRILTEATYYFNVN